MSLQDLEDTLSRLKTKLVLLIKLILKKSYGFRTLKAVQTALYHRLGALPEQQFTHRFW